MLEQKWSADSDRVRPEGKFAGSGPLYAKRPLMVNRNYVWKNQYDHNNSTILLELHMESTVRDLNPQRKFFERRSCHGTRELHMDTSNGHTTPLLHKYFLSFQQSC